jgi:hypothetical protein
MPGLPTAGEPPRPAVWAGSADPTGKGGRKMDEAEATILAIAVVTIMVIAWRALR